MTIKQTFRGLIARMSALSSVKNRKTLALPAALTYSARAEALPKPTSANLRKFAETPVARKAINTIKDRVAGMQWRIQAKNGRALGAVPNGQERVQALTDNLDSPNNDDSFRSANKCSKTSLWADSVRSRCNSPAMRSAQ